MDPERYGWSSQFRWPLMSIAVGIVSGLGAIFFEELLRWSLHVLLQLPTGFIEPVRGSEAALVTALGSARSWLYLVIPALGGLVSGIMVYYIAPEAEGHGTDAMIEAFHRRGGYIRTRVPLVKILASALTIGSGGVFGPSVFMGAMLGGAFGYLGHQVAPGWVIHPNSFVLVGIGGFFAGVAKVPVASIIMACEMCASYTLLVPLMLVSTISYLLLGRVSLYEKQVVTRLASPAHMSEFTRGLLEKMSVDDVVKPQPVVVVGEKMPLGQLVEVMAHSQQNYFPVVSLDGKVTGILSINDIREVMFEESVRQLIVAKDVATPNMVRVFGKESLQEALDKMVLLKVDELPVVQEAVPDEIIAMISKRDIIGYYHSRTGAKGAGL